MPVLTDAPAGQRIALGLECGTKATQFATQFSVIVDFPVEGNCNAPVEGQLRLRRVLRVDDAQATRSHGRILAKRYDGIGDITPVQNALKELFDSRVRIGPANRDCNSAHWANRC